MNNKPTIMRINLKVSDQFFATLEQDGAEIGTYNGYVPTFMPGEHWGDYVELDIDVATGRIVNWNVPNATELKKTFKQAT